MLQSCTSVDDKICTSCRACEAGSYVYNTCTGGLSDDTQCRACEACGSMQMMASCMDLGEKTCTDCPSCGVDKYMTGCNGTIAPKGCEPCLVCDQVYSDASGLGVYVKAFASTRCNGTIKQDVTQCKACTCPKTIDSGSAVGDYYFIYLDPLQPCQNGRPDHHCAPTQFADLGNYMGRIGPISLMSLLVVSPIRDVTLQLDTFRRDFRNCLIDTYPAPQIQSIVFDELEAANSDSNLQPIYSVRFWTVYETGQDAIQAQTQFHKGPMPCTMTQNTTLDIRDFQIWTAFQPPVNNTPNNTTPIPTTTPPPQVIPFTLDTSTNSAILTTQIKQILEGGVTRAFNNNPANMTSFDIVTGVLGRRLLEDSYRVNVGFNVVVDPDDIPTLLQKVAVCIPELNADLARSFATADLSISYAVRGISYESPDSGLQVVVLPIPNRASITCQIPLSSLLSITLLLCTVLILDI
jgi:hypothetical protein